METNYHLYKLFLLKDLPGTLFLKVHQWYEILGTNLHHLLTLNKPTPADIVAEGVPQNDYHVL